MRANRNMFDRMAETVDNQVAMVRIGEERSKRWKAFCCRRTVLEKKTVGWPETAWQRQPGSLFSRGAVFLGSDPGLEHAWVINEQPTTPLPSRSKSQRAHRGARNGRKRTNLRHLCTNSTTADRSDGRSVLREGKERGLFYSKCADFQSTNVVSWECVNAVVLCTKRRRKLAGAQRAYVAFQDKFGT